MPDIKRMKTELLTSSFDRTSSVGEVGTLSNNVAPSQGPAARKWMARQARDDRPLSLAFVMSRGYLRGGRAGCYPNWGANAYGCHLEQLHRLVELLPLKGMHGANCQQKNEPDHSKAQTHNESD